MPKLATWDGPELLCGLAPELAVVGTGAIPELSGGLSVAGGLRVCAWVEADVVVSIDDVGGLGAAEAILGCPCFDDANAPVALVTDAEAEVAGSSTFAFSAPRLPQEVSTYGNQM
jgi:hypothetical protein